MDAVITYVDGLDPLWQKDYDAVVGAPRLAKRFRDWGTLRYLLRGVETCMPFIRKVFLVVSRESQVPEWVNRETVTTVLHSDIIPAEFLPTFNSTTIEMFLHRIPGLDEQFIYFNDDFFPLMPFDATDFFTEDGRAVAHHSAHFFAGSLYMVQTRRADRLARKALGLKKSIRYVRPQHTVTTMLRSCSEKVSAAVEEDIRASLTTTRDAANLNQYIWSDALYYQGLTEQKGISNKHFSLAVADVDKICRFIVNPTRKMACINDVEMSDARYMEYRRGLLEAFGKRFPQPSKYENKEVL